MYYFCCIVVIAKTLKKSFVVRDLDMAIWLHNVTIRLDFHYSWEGGGGEVVSHSHVLFITIIPIQFFF